MMPIFFSWAYVSMIVYHSPSCANCRRIVDIIQRIPSLSNSVALKNVDTLAPHERSGLQFVPTIVDSGGRQYVGSKAFEYLKQYENEMDLQFAPLASGRLAFSSLDGIGETEYPEMYGDFIKPE